MTKPMGHADAEELLAPYALDAVDHDEADAVAAHLEYCPGCDDVVRDYRETAAYLASTAEGLVVPGELWDSIEAGLEEQPPRFDVSRFTRPGNAGEPQDPAPQGQTAPSRGAPGIARSRSIRILGASLGVAAILVVVLGITIWSLASQINHDTDPTRKAASNAMADPNSRKLMLSSQDGATSVEAVILPDGTGCIINNNLAALPEGRTYQLWSVVNGEKVSDGVLGAKLDIVTFKSERPVSALAITDERSGGVVASANQPVVIAKM